MVSTAFRRTPVKTLIAAITNTVRTNQVETGITLLVVQTFDSIRQEARFE